MDAAGPPASVGTIGTDQWANRVVVDATSSYAYVNCWNNSAETVRQYAIAPGVGTLSDLTPNSVGTGGDPLGIITEPTGRYLYVANSSSNNVQQYALDSTTGLLTSNGTIGAGGGSGPRGMVVLTEEVTD